MARHELMDDGGPVLVVDGDTARPVGAGDRVPCPDCNGVGAKMVPYWQRHTPCPTCAATGRVPAQFFALIELGGRLMKGRVDANRRLRVEATRLGLRPCVLIDQELGRCCLRCDQGPEQCRCTLTELEQAARGGEAAVNAASPWRSGRYEEGS